MAWGLGEDYKGSALVVTDNIETPAAAPESPGWEAINVALEQLYHGQEPIHWGTFISFRLGGPDPLDGISAWKRLEPLPHWHFVTFGLSELYAKESEVAETSGYGFELTFRLACKPDDAVPPNWVFSFLQNLARYVFGTGNIFMDGHSLNANGPIALETDTQLCSIGFVEDPELPAIDTPHGRVEFLQVVGLTIEEEQAAKRWNARKLLEWLRPHMPLWISNLDRGPLLDQPSVPLEVAQGAGRDALSSGWLSADMLGWVRHEALPPLTVIEITLGAKPARDLLRILPMRLRLGLELRVVCQSRGKLLVIAPADADQVTDGDELRIELSSATLDALLRTLAPRAGSYATPGFPALSWRIEQSLIRDASGEVVETIG